jgi:hypothetical protein
LKSGPFADGRDYRAKNVGEAAFRGFTPQHREHVIGAPNVVFDHKPKAISAQKADHGRKRCSLIALEKWVIFGNSERQRRRKTRDIAFAICPLVRGRAHALSNNPWSTSLCGSPVSATRSSLSRITPSSVIQHGSFSKTVENFRKLPHHLFGECVIVHFPARTRPEVAPLLFPSLGRK